MSVSILFIFIFGRIIYFCIKNRKWKLSQLYKEIFYLYIFCAISINAGYAFKIGNIIVTFNTFLSLLLLILSGYFIFKKMYNKKVLRMGVVFWISVIVGLMFMKLFPYEGGVVQNIADWDHVINGSKNISYTIVKPEKLFNYLLGVFRVPIILSVISFISNAEDVENWIDKLYRTLGFFEIFGILEFVLKMVLHIDIYKVVSVFIGETNSFPKMQGLTTEASKYAMVLFMYSLIVVLKYRFEEHIIDSENKGLFKSQINVKHLGIIYVLMVLTTSLTAYYLLVISVMIVLLNVNVNKKIYVFVVGAVGAGVLLIVGLPDYFIQRLGMINKVLRTLSKGNEFHSYLTSEGARISSIYYAIKAFFARPLFGIGIGGIDVHSMFFAILANFGVIGTYSYFDMWKRMVNYKNNKKIYWLIIASTFLFGGLGYFVELYLPFIISAYCVSNIQCKIDSI